MDINKKEISALKPELIKQTADNLDKIIDWMENLKNADFVTQDGKNTIAGIVSYLSVSAASLNLPGWKVYAKKTRND